MSNFTIGIAVIGFLLLYGFIKSRTWGIVKKFAVGVSLSLVGIWLLSSDNLAIPVNIARPLWVVGLCMFIIFMVHQARPLKYRVLKSITKERAGSYGAVALIVSCFVAIGFDPAIGSRFWNVADKLAEESPAQARSKEEALLASSCQMHVANEARFKNKANFIGFPRTGRTENIISVHGNVELMNGMGLMVPHNYYCKFKNKKLIEMKVYEG